MTEESKVDERAERLVRDILGGRDGEVRFRLENGSVSMLAVTQQHDASGDGHVTFAKWMSDLIHSRRMSQEAMARALGVSLKTVNRWVNGRTEPRMRELRRIQEAFGVAPPL
jgi:DNA-binding XRE family transcriptional regulator